MKILLVDDDPRLRDLVRTAFERADFTVIGCADGASALTHAARETPALVVLDVGLPDMDGFDVCRRIRARSDVPILFLTARDEEIDRIVGLELGADDYVTKPFSTHELVARVRAILRRHGAGARAEVLRKGRLSLDRGNRICAVDGRTVTLTGTEFHLLDALLGANGRLLTRTALATAIWGAGGQQSDRTLDSHLRNLRRKLGDADLPDAIETLHAQGMRLGPCT